MITTIILSFLFASITFAAESHAAISPNMQICDEMKRQFSEFKEIEPSRITFNDNDTDEQVLHKLFSLREKYKDHGFFFFQKDYGMLYTQLLAKYVLSLPKEADHPIDRRALGYILDYLQKRSIRELMKLQQNVKHLSWEEVSNVGRILRKIYAYLMIAPDGVKVDIKKWNQDIQTNWERIQSQFEKICKVH
jgi:hypothetical protein